MKRQSSVSTKLTTPPSSANADDAQPSGAHVSAPSSRPVLATRLEGGAEAVFDDDLANQEVQATQDWVAVEEPLELRIRGESLVVLLRSPGMERELIAGFLASEGLLNSSSELQAIEACRHTETGEPEPNIWNVALAPGVPTVAPQSQRLFPVGSTCGLCGARSIDELKREVRTVPAIHDAVLPADFFARSDLALRERQQLHRRTAGCHGAGLFDMTGELLAFAEDVGRHNAVDKIIGLQLLADQYPIEVPVLLQVTGRISFEIVQKCALAGVCAVAGAGAPTSLAVEAAHELGMHLFGLVRPQRANRYCGALEWQGARMRQADA